jgi:hypothetical protein
LYCRQNALVGVEGGKHDYANVGVMLPQALKGFYTVHLGHFQVQHHDVRPQLDYYLDSFNSIFCLTDHPKVRLGTQYGGESISQDWMVVNNHYLNLLDQN